MRTPWLGLSLLLITLSACSSSKSSAPAARPNAPSYSEGITNGVVRATAQFALQIGGQPADFSPQAKVEVPITIENPAAISFALNMDDFEFPPIQNTLLSFGDLAVSDLFDNDLRVCGTTRNQKCTRAYIQIFTTGTPEAGLYNSLGGYAVPLFARVEGGTNQVIGLNAGGAAVMQLVTIATNKNVLRRSEFTDLKYEILSDLTEAGAGSYATTLVVEYGLLE